MSAGILDFNTAKTLTQIEAEQRTRAVVDAEDIKSRLHGNPRGFVEWLFSGRAFCTGKEARIGDVHGTPGASLSIALSGPDCGLWHDHATGEGGDLIALYMAYMGYQDGKNFQLALKEIAKEYFNDPVDLHRAAWQPSAADRIAEKKQKLGTKPRDDMEQLGAPVATYRYKDLNGNMIASVVRFEPDGTRESKTFLPYCFRDVNGRREWKAGAPERHRPLYRLPEIAFATTVVLVEGEGKADSLAARGIDATSAMQGSKAPIDKTDWAVLRGKTVIIWPDNDDPGQSYARSVAAHLTGLGCTVRIVPIPREKAQAWDAGDCIAEGGDPQALIHAAVPWTDTAPKTRIKLLSLEEIEDLAPPSWLIDDTITEGGLSVLWGRSGTYKSFVGLDMGMTVATEGASWHGKPVRHGNVVYVAAEGAHGLGKRAIGWMKTKGKGLSAPKIRLVPHGLVLTGEDAQELVNAILNLNSQSALIIIDTLARTFGAGDENRTVDMNAYVAAADLIRSQTGAHVMIIHHSGKDEDKGERGNIALRGAADTIIAVQRDGDSLKLINEAPKGKQKDAPEFPTIALRTVSVEFDHKGDRQSTLTLVQDDNPLPEGSTKPAEDSKKRRHGTVQSQILKAIGKAKEPLGINRILMLTKADKSSVYKAIKALVEQNDLEEITSDDGAPALWRIP